jgi:flavin reductase (DIM6/NTAB) family NADH-FMN oxidoreductase RutF
VRDAKWRIPSPDVSRALQQQTTDSPVPHAEGVSEEEFKAAMARLAAGVVLVSAHDPDDGPRGEDVGMTATAFLSVSLEPPLVMVSVRDGSRMDEVLERQPRWAACLLTEGQRHIAGRFAMKGRLSDRLLFKELPHDRGEATGAPLLREALAVVECHTEQRVRAGDHNLVIARVLTSSVRHGEGTGPLTYFRGRYRTLS